MVRLRYLENIPHGRITTLISNMMNVREMVREADLVIGSVLVPGTRCPVLVNEEAVTEMRPGSVIVDVPIGQGGCFAASRPTTHSDPVYAVQDVIHTCVGGMPGAAPRTSTFALTNVTLPYTVLLVELGLLEAVRRGASLAKEVNVVEGRMTKRPVAEAHGMEYESLEYVMPIDISTRQVFEE